VGTARPGEVFLRPLINVCAALVLAIAMLTVWAMPARAQDEGSREYNIKAAFVYNFLKYIDFPPGAIAGSTITIGIEGADPSGGAFDLLNGKVVQGKTLSVRHLGDRTDLSGINVVFVPSAERARARTILDNAGHGGILTIGESVGFAQSGGMIGFVNDLNRVRFEINQAVAARAGLKISSQLLRLATIVK
jgi:hypothetical protein